ncbi:hypothetical protein ACJDT4_13205 [Clostridium neuense]|uniref:Uncharacterized protein n=1 Tax=Clostridium neuense TaxID=1728934 RepID=A0ABW8TIR2_9CLOT
MLKLKHIFSIIKGDSVVVYSKDLTTKRYYRCTNILVGKDITEEIQEISKLEFRQKLAEQIYKKSKELPSMGMATAYIIDFQPNNEINFEIEKQEKDTPHEKLIKDAQKSLGYSYEDAEFYARKLEEIALNEYKKCFKGGNSK